MKQYLIPIIAFLLLPAIAFGQNVIQGTISDADTGSPLVGANVLIIGTNQGAAANAEGDYEIDGLEDGTYTLRASMIGYKTIKVTVTLEGGVKEVDFEMHATNTSLEALKVFASRAVARETPVAFSDISAEQISNQLASRDIPMVLNTTPSVYATNQGGGAGDARVNIRGFNQRNVAIMINGVPVNDMENGWVYWSNWDGVGDVATSIQVQRGLSAINLATPSIGGTMNILTDPAAAQRGGMVKQEFGSYGFKKTTVVLNSGLISDKFAFTVAGVKKTGDGFYDGTWTDSYAYYLGASYTINDNNRLDLYAMGAPQRHGQNLYAQNIAAYSHELARELGYSQAALDAFPEAGRTYNENYNGVSSSYSGKQWKFGHAAQRYDGDFINERENFYHKPQVNLNWFSQINDDLFLSTVAYYSGGQGGGTGTLGEIEWDYSGPSRIADWDATIADNRLNVDGDERVESDGILRASRNNQWTIGLISKATWAIKNWTFVGGVDLRTAEIEHFREVYDLLGGDYYIKTDDAFNPNQKIGLGDKVNYYFTNDVNWAGVFLQAEYDVEKFNFYGMAGYSGIKYKHYNHFKKDANGQHLTLESDFITGYQIKGGLLYRASDNIDVYANIGLVSKVPIFDGVINDRAAVINENPTNEKFYSYEVGANFHLLDRKLTIKTNFYYTIWNNRTYTTVTQNANLQDFYINIEGVNALHAGFELETAFQPVHWFRFDGALSIGHWKYTDNVHATIEDAGEPDGTREADLYIKDLRVGAAPQTQIAYGFTVLPIQNLSVQLVGRSYFDYWSDFSPLSRTDQADEGVQGWKVPSYTVLELHAGYTFEDLLSGTEFFVNVFNLTNELYIQDATDNSRFNAFSDNGVNHSADDAEVFLGLPRRFNLGVSVRF